MGGAAGTRRAARGACPRTRPYSRYERVLRPWPRTTRRAPTTRNIPPSPPRTAGQARAYDTVVVHMSRRRLILTAFVVVALAGLAGGLLAARGSSAAVRSGVIARGAFHSVSWSTRGTAAIVGKNGHAVLELRNFQTQRAPELWIVLEGKGGVMTRRQLSHLNRSWGNQDYAVSADVAAHPPARVLIYCSKCGKVWGYAPLRASHPSTL
jgi:hypothetical protein